jgi:hypothetical protein
VHAHKQADYTLVCIAINVVLKHDIEVDAKLLAELNDDAAHAMLTAAARCWRAMDGHGVATTLHAVSELGVEPPEALRRGVAAAIRRTAPNMTASDVHNLLPALRALGEALSGPALHALHARVAQLAPALSAKSASNFVLRMASARQPFTHARAREPLRAALLRTMPAMSAKQVSIVLKSLPRPGGTSTRSCSTRSPPQRCARRPTSLRKTPQTRSLGSRGCMSRTPVTTATRLTPRSTHSSAAASC